MRDKKHYKLNKTGVAALGLSLVCAFLITVIVIQHQNYSKALIKEESIQSNKLDNTLEQVIITADRVDIKSMKAYSSDTVGYVYKGEVYTILEKSEDNLWIHIKTNNNINGYIYVGDSHQYISYVTKNEIKKEVEEETKEEEKVVEEVTTTPIKTTAVKNTSTTKKTTTTTKKVSTTTSTTTTKKVEEVVKKTYTIKATAPDSQSPARILSVYENGTKISFKQINYTDGSLLCSGTCNVNASELESTLQVVLNDGTKVSARLE